jgi:hypothetical protein
VRSPASPVFSWTVLQKKVGFPGVALAIQTFDYALWHLQVHTLVADGLFLKRDIFYVMPDIDLQPLVELFKVSVLNMLKQEGPLGGDLIKKILSWRYNSGFSVHNRVSVKADLAVNFAIFCCLVDIKPANM